MTSYGFDSIPLSEIKNNFLNSFKIGIYLNAPLRSKQSSTTSQLLSYCAQLDTLQLTTYRNTEWNDLVKEAQSNITTLSNLPSLDSLPPSLTSIFTHLVPTTTQSKDIFDDYLSQIALLNQLNSIAHQLQHDVTTFSNHKYIAHQIAILYQTLGQVGGPLGENTKYIEAKFDEIKSTIEQSKTPFLSNDQKSWLVNLTNKIIAEIQTSAFTLPKIQPLAHYATNN